MKLLPEMAKIKDRVKVLLINHEHLRNSDNRLISNIWIRDIIQMKLNPHTLKAYDFLSLYAEEKLTNTETIRRVRQKIQEENPELRGTVNEARQKEGEEVRKEISKR